MSVLATRAAVAAAAVLFVAAAVMLRHLVTWKLVVTVAALLFGFGEAILDLVRDSDTDLDPAKRSSSTAAGEQEPSISIEDDTTRALIAQLDRFKWKVDLKVERARQLRAADRSWMGVPTSSDPYVKIQLGSQMHKTKPVNKTLDPVWNQCYELELGAGYGAGLTDKLRLTVYDADAHTTDDELGFVELPLWRMVQPQHFEYAEIHKDSTVSQDATMLQYVPAESLEAQWYTLTSMCNGTAQQTDQQIRAALQLRIVPSDAESGGFSSAQRAGAVGNGGGRGVLNSTLDSPATPGQAETSVGLNPAESQRLGSSALAGGGSPDTGADGSIECARGTVAPQLQHAGRASGVHELSPALSIKPGGSSLPVVAENAESVSYIDDGDRSSLYDRDYLESGGDSSEMWEDISDTSSVSSTGSDYSSGHVGEMYLSPSRRPAGAGFQKHPRLSAVPAGSSVRHHADMGAVAIPRPLTRDSLPNSNVVLTVTVVELCGYGGSGENRRNGGLIHKKLEAEWYVKLRLMKPQGRGFVQVDKPYRTEFQRALPKSQKGQRSSDEALPIHMQFKFGRTSEQYQIDEQMLREGVLRFKLKVKKFFKFRTLVKSNSVPLRAILDQSEIGGAAIDPLEQEVKLFDGTNVKAQLRICLNLSSRT